MDECIHGFERELCDICAPRRREPQVDADGQVKTLVPKRRAASRKPESLRSTPALPRDMAASAVAAQAAQTPVPVFSQQRVYHWTHVSNLPGILESGEIRAGATPVLDVSSEATRALRASVTAASGAPLADHVPFSLSPHATAWDTVRSGAEGYEWSDAARTAKATDFVMLVVPISALGDDFVVTEGDAAVQGVRAGVGVDDAAGMVRRFSLADPDLLEPEVLVPSRVAFDAVTLVGVPNDKVRDAVKNLVADAGGHAPRISVYPPWFRPSPVEQV
ncbi:DarT ssDNA thymidine ADP-ribosyltransferase family protein [Frigoribacterium sp. CFBP9039]|uniref:DarT ssDNA thymidine ADP-ribosyltransferase family protein n=1 Tax=Frigoribacterium TaxID=96492 RepID=UPI001A7EB8B8|nr:MULTISPECIES: DarT ssDNA thymidine ADP-ribosyltransferase family protein [Frigoribacterium]MCJ0700386.1 DUF4433 domain-containing protein [Frigoribacterium faeni]MDY0892570.1 DarT ssDNA thymidine ADP-ribosyltransferase family protein [Frigoribacterium sp. CFBP9030]MDY0945425.1 DarT ssDNA thymidine ADP-ribosyltransferase family protein [Frigoribacterium sp. CFBP9039]